MKFFYACDLTIRSNFLKIMHLFTTFLFFNYINFYLFWYILLKFNHEMYDAF